MTEAFGVLGPVQVVRDGIEIPRGPRRQQIVLALLLVHAGQPVSTAAMVAYLWSGTPPAYAVNIVHRHVGELRRFLEPGLAPRAEGRWIKREGNSYRFAGGPELLDITRFRKFAEHARVAARGGDTDRAMTDYLEALKLWRDLCCAGLDGLATVHPAFVGIDYEVSAVAIEAADFFLNASASAQLVPQLQRIADRSPLDEGLNSRLMLCLAAAGRRAEALTRHGVMRRRLAEELGVGPGTELSEAHHQILSGETLPAREGIDAAPIEPRVVSPAQLPADLPVFVGRESHLRSVETLAAQSAGPGNNSPLVVAIDGMPGVGKTTLAIHLAHRVAHLFVDGSIFLNLRGFDKADRIVPPTTAIKIMLNSLGISDAALPAEHDARVGLFRSLIAARRLLLVLDNVRDVDQVADLLPGSPGCMTIVTSRARLGGLVLGGARAVALDVMSAAEARETFVERLGADRTIAEQEVIGELVRYCGRLPLALSIVAAKAAENPPSALTGLARRIRGLHGGLDSFASDETQMDLREIFSWSYASLGPEAARVFRLLSAYGGASIPISAAASLVGLSISRTRQNLKILTRNRLLQELSPDRYAFHDLLLAYAAELAGSRDGSEELSAAHIRLVSYFLNSAYTASALLGPDWIPDRELTPEPGVVVEPIEDSEAATQWFKAEGDALEQVILRCAEGELPGPAWRLAMCAMPFWERHSLKTEWSTVARALVDSASARGDREALAHGLRIMAGAIHLDGRHAEAISLLRQAGQIWDEIGRPEEQSYVWLDRAMVNWRSGDVDQAFRDNAEALEVALRYGQKKAAANAVFGEAVCDFLRGNLTSASALLGEARENFETLGDPYGVVACLVGAADVALQERRYDDAFARLREAELKLMGNHWPSAWYDYYSILGSVHESLGDHAEAIVCWKRAVQYLDEYDPLDLHRIRVRLDALEDAP